jgi:hypothetical protein
MELRGSDIYTYSMYAVPGLVELGTGADEDIEGGE